MNRFQANLCLLTTTMCWAPEVVLMKRFPAGVPALAVITLSTALGAAILLLVLFAHVRVRPTRGFLCWAALLGLLTAVQSTLAVLGSRQLPVSTSMFLLSLYVVGVPVVMVIIRPFRRWRGQPLEPAPAPRTWAGVALIMVGLALAVQLGSGSAQLVPIAILLVSVFAIRLGWFRAVGYQSLFDSPAGWLDTVTLPVIALAVSGISGVAPQVRGALLDALGKDYVRTLRSRATTQRSRRGERGARQPRAAIVASVVSVMRALPPMSAASC